MSTGGILEKKYFRSEQVTLDATGDKLTFYPGCPVDITGFGVVQTVAATGTGLVIKADSDLSGESRGDGDVGTLTPGVAPTVNTVYMNKLSDPVQLDAGEGVVLEVTTAQSAGDGVVFIEYIEHPITVPIGGDAPTVGRNQQVTLKTA